MSEMSETTQHITRSCSSDGEQEPERPERMREWLVRMINTPGRFPGLDWLDPDKTVFKVPWIHAKKRGYNRERDAALFKAWAIHSGKYRDESDPTVWKINFRCAINGLKDIVELKDLQTEDCRVYKVLPSTRKNKRTRKRTPGRSTDPYTFPQGTYAGSSPVSAWQNNYAPLGGLQVEGSYPPPIGVSTVHYPPPCARIPPYSTFATQCMAPTLPPPPQYSESNSYQYTSSVPIPYSEPCTSVYNPTSIAMDMRGESPDSGIVEPSHSMAASPPQPSPGEPISYSTAVTTNSMTDPTCSYPLSVITSTSSTTSDPQIIDVIEELNSVSPHPTSPPLSSPPPPSHQMNVSVFYGTTPVISKNISSPKGCRISFGHTNPPTSVDSVKMEDLFGSMEADQIYLSPNHPVPRAQELLESMLRGLVIETHNNDVYATALCRCMVHCGTSYYQHSVPLEKETRTKVFDYNKFQTALEQHVMHCSPLPEPHIIFSLGQLWGPQHPVTLNLISIVVTNTQAKNDIQTYLPPFYPSHNLLTTIPNPVEVQQSSSSDARADQFLSSVLPC